MIATIRSALVLVILVQPGFGYLSTDLPMSTSFPPALQTGHLQTVVLDVSGLWATLCERYVERALIEPLEGVERVEADHQPGEAEPRVRM